MMYDGESAKQTSCECVCAITSVLHGVSHMASNPSKNPPPWRHGWQFAHTNTTLCLTFFLFSHTLLCSSHPFAHQRMSAALLFFFRKIFFFFLMECVWGETEIMRRIWDQDSSSRDPVVVITIYITQNGLHSINPKRWKTNRQQFASI